ncbi:hypothetical protein K466DRAFT_602836 [Polyporus arcularius HHB13444]|uniref:Fungal-type protein kinase domain-containing protein n=1 Tax=Polyporus arcularius HHB13444 TaxID=1314778 RepID=A0A5C3P4B4_9APHY|nr:hypothetical protein K466DRAFT_602836 [Polyporus arcularius HHB13444]
MTEMHGVSDKVLHRITGRRSGKPLWEYSSIEQFVRAMICVLETHKFLSDNGIVLGDISAGNILIDVKYADEDRVPEEYPVEDTRAFFTDFDLPLAALLLERDRSVQTQTKARSSDGMTGTVTFMSQRVLYAAIKQRHIVRTTEDDLESFSWVVFYAVYRHALQDEEGLERMTTEFAKIKTTHSRTDTTVCQDFRDEFDSIFSATSIRDLHSKRAGPLGRHFHELFPYLWAYALNCDADGYGRPLAGLLLVVWAFLKSFQVSNEPYKLSDDPLLAEWEADYGQYAPRVVVGKNDHGKPSQTDVLSMLDRAMRQIAEIKASLASDMSD